MYDRVCLFVCVESGDLFFITSGLNLRRGLILETSQMDVPLNYHLLSPSEDGQKQSKGIKSDDVLYEQIRRQSPP